MKPNLMLALVLLLFWGQAARAQFAYTNINGTISITGYTGSNDVVVIPDTINGLPVTAIGDSAFLNDLLTSVTIPNSVTSIGGGAFQRCSNLTSVTIPNSVTSIGGGAFAYSSLTNVTLGDSVTSIGNGAFFACTNLISVTIPNSVISIADYSFYQCYSLTNVSIPNSVTGIGDYTFQYCITLTSVTVPNSVTNIGASAFLGCTSLTAINVETNNPAYSSVGGVLFNQSLTTLIQYPGGKVGSYLIPNSVTSIGGGAFFGCTNLTGVTIPNSVTSIRDWVFYYCTSLTNVTIPDSVTTIGDSAFSSCGLTRVTIPNSVISIGGYAFLGCTSLSSVIIGSGVTNIGYGAFEDCPNLLAADVDVGNTSFLSVDGVLFDRSESTLIQFPVGNGAMTYTIPNSVTSIGASAFEGCTSLTNVTIGSGVTSIGVGAFASCTNLTTVYFQGNAPHRYSSQSGVFALDNKATGYYLPGTTGWGAPLFDGLPTAVWTLPYPLILNSSHLGVQSNRFSFTVSWATNLSVVVEAATDLVNPIWSPVQTNAFTNGSLYFSDPQWTNYPSRFYRVRSQ